MTVSRRKMSSRTASCRLISLLPLCACAAATPKPLAFDPVDRDKVVDAIVADVTANSSWVETFVEENQRAPTVVLVAIENTTSEKIDGATIARMTEDALRAELGGRIDWQLGAVRPCGPGCDVAAVLRLASILDETCLKNFSDAEEGDAPPDHGVIARSVFSQGTLQLHDANNVQLTLAIGEAQSYSEQEAPAPAPGRKHPCSERPAPTR